MSLSEHAVHDALASLINPDTGRDYVSSHCVTPLKITGSDVSLTPGGVGTLTLAVFGVEGQPDGHYVALAPPLWRDADSACRP